MKLAPFIAMTTAEATVTVTMILAVTALVLLVVWQLFSLARRGMELRAQRDQHPSTPSPTASRRELDEGVDGETEHGLR
jgi:hypothetical protein